MTLRWLHQRPKQRRRLMNRIALALLALTVSASPAPLTHALTLQYFPTSGNAYLLPASSPSGKTLGYILLSNGQFFVDPARTSVFHPPGSQFFTNTANEISEVDFLEPYNGTSAIIPLFKLFPTPVQSLQELTSKFTNRIYVPSPGGGELQIALEFANLGTPEPIIPEPATGGLLAAAALALHAARRPLG